MIRDDDTPDILQPVAKQIGTSTRLPIYAIAIPFRGQNRTLEYTLFATDDHPRIVSAAWLRCDARLPPGTRCECCPDPNAVEELAFLAVITLDAARIGPPLSWQDLT